jgi:hypothetical protein
MSAGHTPLIVALGLDPRAQHQSGRSAEISAGFNTELGPRIKSEDDMLS